MAVPNWGRGDWGTGGLGDGECGRLGDWGTDRFVAVLLPITHYHYPLPLTHYPVALQ